MVFCEVYSINSAILNGRKVLSVQEFKAQQADLQAHVKSTVWARQSCSLLSFDRQY